MKESQIKWFKRFVMALALLLGYGCVHQMNDAAETTFTYYNLTLLVLYGMSLVKEKPVEPPAGHRIPPFF